MKIDIGGTPANLIEKDKISLMSEKVKLVALLDPFDVSRAERTVVLSKKFLRKIKIPIIIESYENISAEKAKIDIIKFREILNSVNKDISKIFPQFPENEIKKVYEKFKNDLIEICNKSENLRDFMNNLYFFFLPKKIETIKLEDFLSENKNYILYLVKKYKFKIRAFCKCGKIYNLETENLNEKFCPDCSIELKDTIEQGRYIPEGSFFRLIIIKYGFYASMSKKSEYLQETLELCKREDIQPKIFFLEEPENTMFESYMFRNLFKLRNDNNIEQKTEVSEEKAKMTDTIKGFQDISAEEARKITEIRKIIERNFQLYGFEPAETPVIEERKFVQSDNVTDEAVSDIFKLEDKGKRQLALRYEFTFQLKRLAKNKKLPYKRYQIGPVFRDEPVTSNRFRQFSQADIDIVGSSVRDEAEILALTSKIMKELGIKAIININNRKLLNEILSEQNIKEKDKIEVIKEIDKLDKQEKSQVQNNLKKLNAIKILEILEKPESYFKKYKAYKEIEELIKFCKIYAVKVNFLPSLARGLSYYNGSVFEIKTSEMKETIAAGGSYLVNNVQSTGISFGLERLSQLAKIKVENKEALIISISRDEKAIKLAENLRKQGIQTSLWTEKGISKALEYANSYKIPFVIFLGEEEARKKKVKLRDMKSGKEVLVSEKDVVEKLGS